MKILPTSEPKHRVAGDLQTGSFLSFQPFLNTLAAGSLFWMASCTATPDLYKRPHTDPVAAGVDEAAAVKLYHQWHPLEGSSTPQGDRLERSMQQKYGVKDSDMNATNLYKHAMAHDF